MRMRQFRSELPPGQLQFRIFTLRGDKLDRYFLRFAIGSLAQEYGAVLRAAQVSQQRKLVIDDLAFPTFPSLGHSPPPHYHLCGTKYCNRAEDQCRREVNVDASALARGP